MTVNQKLARLIFGLSQHIRGIKALDYVEEFEKTQWLPAQEMQKIQWQKVKTILEHAYLNVPYYRKKFTEAGITHQDINTPHDLLKIPLLTKDDIRENFNDLLSTDMNRPSVTFRTSGSTGIPLEIIIDKVGYAQYMAPIFRALKWYGVDFSGRQARFWSLPLNWRKRIYEKAEDFLLNRIRMPTFQLSEDSLEDFYQRCLRFRPEYIQGYPSAIFAFAQHLKSKPKSERQLGVKVVVCTAETLYDFQRETIEEVFDCKAVNHYGCSELPVIAIECPAGNMHIASENVYLEVVQDNKPAPIGQIAPLVITSLSNYSMPLIRYCNGDMGAILDEKCQCGRTPGMPLMKSVIGRTVDTVFSCNGEPMHATIFTYVAKDVFKTGVIKEYLAIQKRMDLLVIQIVKGFYFEQAAIDNMIRRIKQILGEGMQVEVEYVEAIPREKTGKFRYFKSEISPQGV